MFARELINNYKKPFKITVKTPQRNDLCPCGSGKKYKNCCLEINKEIINKL